MKISVDLPNQIRLDGRDSINLIVGNGMDCVTVFGDGRIVVQGNGGGAASFVVDVVAALRELRGAVQIDLGKSRP
jgi:hypothetical protein